MIGFKGLTEEQLSPVIASILSADIFSAISEYRMLTKSDGENTMMDIVELTENVSKWLEEDVSFAERNTPRHCCAHCIGTCGVFNKRMEKGVWDKETNSFQGSTCRSFVDVDEFLPIGNFVELRQRLPSGEETFGWATTIHLEDGIFSILKEKKNARNGRVVGQSRKVLIADASKGRSLAIKNIRSGKHSLYQTGKIKSSLFVFGNKPIKGETYKEYFARGQEDYRNKRREIVAESFSMSYEDACNFIFENIDGTERVLWNGSSSPESFLGDFYGGISVWEKVEEIKKEKSIKR